MLCSVLTSMLPRCGSSVARPQPLSQAFSRLPAVRSSRLSFSTGAVPGRGGPARAPPPPPAGRMPPPSPRAPPRSPPAPGAPQQKPAAPQGVYTGSNFIKKDSPAKQQPQAKNAGPAVVELSPANIEEMLTRSPVPMIVDCYADWCEPCKQLTPELEKVVRASGGGLRLGKLNVDLHGELAQMLKVEQLPTVYGFFQGKMIDMFVGVPSAGQLKAFLEKMQKLGGGTSAKPLLDEAVQAILAGDIAAARELYKEVLHQPAWKSESLALAGLARCALAEGNAEAASEIVAEIRKSFPESLDDPDVKQAVSAAELVGKPPAAVEPLLARLKANPNDHQARYDLATAYFASGAHAKAIDEGLELLKRDRAWNDQAAKALLLKIFDALGPADPLSVKGRQRFTSILFL